MLAAVIFAVMWALRHRLPAPGDLTWLVLALFATGRFFVFFARSDPPLALGLTNAQWTSLALLPVIVAGWWVTTRSPGFRHRLEGRS